MCSLSSADPAIQSLYTKEGIKFWHFTKFGYFFFWIHSFHTERMTGKKKDGGKFRWVRCVIAVFLSTVLSAAE